MAQSPQHRRQASHSSISSAMASGAVAAQWAASPRALACMSARQHLGEASALASASRRILAQSRPGSNRYSSKPTQTPACAGGYTHFCASRSSAIRLRTHVAATALAAQSGATSLGSVSIATTCRLASRSSHSRSSAPTNRSRTLGANARASAQVTIASATHSGSIGGISSSVIGVGLYSLSVADQFAQRAPRLGRVAGGEPFQARQPLTVVSDEPAKPASLNRRVDRYLNTLHVVAPVSMAQP